MRKEFLQFFRNVPLMVIVLYCVTFDIMSASNLSLEVKDYPIAFYDMDKTTESREVTNKLLQGPYFSLAYDILQEKDIRDLIEQGKVSVVLVFPEGFGKKVSMGTPASMQAIVDGSNSTAAEDALGYINNIVNRQNIEIIFTRWKVSEVTKKLVPNVGSRLRYLYNPNLAEKWYNALQELFMNITLIGILLVATALVNEKQFGTIEQLMVTPLKTIEIMVAKIVPMIMILFVAIFIAVFAILCPLIDCPINGNIWEFFLVSLIFAFTVAGIGLFIATISNSLANSVLFSVLVLVPIMFLSGSWVPIESMPVWMRFLVQFSPLTYYTDLGNTVFVKGNSIFLLWNEILALLGIGITVFVVSAIRFRRSFSSAG